MSIYCRDRVYDVLFDHEFHSVDDLVSCHPQWELGLRLLAKWGYMFTRQADAIRMEPGYSSEYAHQVEHSLEIVNGFITESVASGVVGRVDEREINHAAGRPHLSERPAGPRDFSRFGPKPRASASIHPKPQPKLAPVVSEEGSDPSKRLHLAKGFYLTSDHVTDTAAILARRGSGKSYFAMVIAEEFCRLDLPFVALDPTGAWWGLRAGKDGKTGGGYPIQIIGGEHGDMPVTARMGGLVADYAVKENPCQILVDLSLLTSDEQHFFAYRFFRNIFKNNRKPMHIFVDEADEFAAQFPRSMAEQLVLGQVDRAVRRGRIKGIGMTLITQRSAVLNKNVLTQTGKLYVLHTAGPQDLKAIEGWARNYLDPDVVENLIKALPRLARGILYHITGTGQRPDRYEVRAKRTWDSSKTPKVGEQIVIPPLCEADISKLKDYIETNIGAEQSVDGEVEAPKAMCEENADGESDGKAACGVAKRPRKGSVRPKRDQDQHRG